MSMNAEVTLPTRRECPVDDSLEKPLSLLDQQRQRTRDYVRLHRVRLRQRRSELIAERQQLAQQYKKLVRLADAAAAEEGEETLASRRRDYDVRVNVQQLQREQVRLKRALAEWQAWHSQLRTVLTDSRQELRPSSTLSFTFDLPVWRPRVSRWFAAQLPSRVRELQEEMRLLKVTAIPMDDAVGGGGDTPHSATFGWQVTYNCERGHDFFVSLTKVFPNVSVDEMRQRCWAVCIASSAAISSPYSTLNIEDLTHGDGGSAIVKSGQFRHPSKPHAALHVCQAFACVPIPSGHATGCVSLAKSSDFEQPPSSDFADVSSWVGITRCVGPTTRTEACEVELAAHWRYDTGEPERLRLVNALQNAVSWECSVLPTIPLIEPAMPQYG
ncbi:hypothetical protein BBJ28_00012567 [Nothophytophthora sp. Chile5]|nr:hypothetical protein BBJ28_00012567 [Nothophytophthora sp. Chile5]